MFSPLTELANNFIPSADPPAAFSSSSSSLLKTVLITDDVHCDADFLVNHFLHSFVKAESPTVLVHGAQTLSHYQLVASKCGVHLQSAIDKSAAVAVDGMQLLADALSSPDAHDERFLTRVLFDAIVRAVETLRPGDLSSPASSSPSSPRLLLLIDDLSLLSSLGVSPRHVAAFLYALRRRFATLPVTLVFRLHEDVEEEIEEDEEPRLVPLFAHQCHAHFCVRGLATGFCKEVHGAIEVAERISVDDGDGKNGGDGAMTYVKKKERQFKIGEKSVSIFAPGLSAAVL